MSKTQVEIPEEIIREPSSVNGNKEAFAKAIDAICAQYGFNLVAQPILKPAFDGSFTISAQMVVVKRS